jgi:hypothetical protein
MPTATAPTANNRGMGRGQGAGRSVRATPRQQADANKLISYNDLENAGDRQLEQAIHSWLNRVPETLRFSRARLRLSELAGTFTEDPGLYLSDGDEEGYENVMSLVERYAREQDVDPIVCAPEPDSVAPALMVLDGCHRLCAAAEAGREWIDAYVAVT